MRLIIPLLIVFILSSCNTSRRTTVNQPEIPPAQPETVIVRPEADPVSFRKPDLKQMLDPLRVEFESAEMKGSMILENPTDQYTFTFNIRMIRDSIIWMQLKKFGLEGARVLATRDSLFAVDRLHRTYLRKSWDQIRNQMNAPVDFNALYELLAGNPVYFTGGQDSLQTTENMKYVSSQDTDRRVEIGINAVTGDMVAYIIKDLKKDNVVNIQLSKHKNLYDKKKFSYLRDIEILSNNAKLLYVNLSFDEVIRNQSFRTPFEIPIGYKATEQ